MHLSRILLLANCLLLSCWIQSSEAGIPMSMLIKMSQMHSTEEFISEMLVNVNRSNAPDGSLEDLLFTKSGAVDPNNVEYVLRMTSQPAGCIPNSVAVELPRDPNPLIVYFPICVRIQRCGGCCGHHALECAPTSVSVKHFHAYRARYAGAGSDRLEFDGTEDIEMEIHHACECRCRIQPYHCMTAIKEYVPDDCRCRCKNEQDALHCAITHRWDDNLCKCVCSRMEKCLSGEIFDTNICMCTEVARVPTTVEAYDPCAHKTCPPKYVLRKMSAYFCNCQLVTSLPRRQLGQQKKVHITDRFPMMRAGVFDQH